MMHLNPTIKAAKRNAEKKTQRLKHAAELSRSKTADEICTELAISKRTLKRYMADPLWQEYGGIQLTMTERGRPTRETLSETEKQSLAEAEALHAQGKKWVEIVQLMGIKIGRLEYLRRKEKQQKSEVSA